ncbi:MAG: AAA family ATPase [Anaerolineae bacterium]|nr:AAA family ATPase [Anaerolineae bacterium]
MRRILLVKELEPEQKAVLNIATMPRRLNEFVIVQGVAGSGKTTIALHTMKVLGEIAKRQPSHERTSMLLLTYNNRLVEYFTNTLRGLPELVSVFSNDGNLHYGNLSVLALQDLFRLTLHDEQSQVLNDGTCIKELGYIAANRGVGNLLPSQIFALITTFLRGRPELLELPYDELYTTIEAEMRRSLAYRMYGDSLKQIRQFLLQTYEDWKGDRLDRSGVASQFHHIVTSSENHLRHLQTLTASAIRGVSARYLGDRDSDIGGVMQWLRTAMLGFEQCEPVERKAQVYLNLLNGNSISQTQLDQLNNDLLIWIRQFGLRIPTIWEQVGIHLRNPVIIVDEVQDLSAIECEALIGLWFQTQRKDNSRLILLGDLNQQMSPSGFEWDYVLKLIAEKSKLYGYASYAFDLSQGFTADENDISTPFRVLNNNYRTSEEIAKTVHSMARQVASKSLEPDLARRYLKHIIQPDLTLPINLAEKIYQIPEQERIPKILIGSHTLFIKALKQYVATYSKIPTDEEESEFLATVIITEHTDQLDAIIREDQLGHALALLSYIPVMSCKGLEFDHCILFGISTKGTDRIEADIVAKWYTSFTRAKLKLLVYLSLEEFNYIQQAGWVEIPSEVALVQHVDDVEGVLEALHWVGNTEIDDEGHYVLGEINLARFQRTHNERFLLKSLQHFTEGSWGQKYADAAAVGADWFEQERHFLEAANYNSQAGRIVDEVRCLQRECQMLSADKEAEITRLRNRAQSAIEKLPEDAYDDRTQAWLFLEEWHEAIDNATKSNKAIHDQAAQRIFVATNEYIQRGEHTKASELATHLQQAGFLAEAADAWVELKAWEKAINCALEVGGDYVTMVNQRAMATAKLYIDENKDISAVEIADLLDKYQQYNAAANVWSDLRKWFKAVTSLIQIPDLRTAEETANRASESVQAQCFEIIAEAYYEKGRDSWPRAFHFYYRSGNADRQHYIVQRCRNEQDHITLTRCWVAIGELEKARAVANDRQLQDNHAEAEIAAQCWKIAQDWESAASAWMYAYYREHDKCETLIGPNPNDRLREPSARRFFMHYDDNRERYGITPEDWRKAMRTSAQSDQQTQQAINILIENASSSVAWQEDVQTYIIGLKRTLKRSNLESSRMVPRIPEIPLNENRRVQLWRSCETDFSLLRQQAENIADIMFEAEETKLQSINMLYNICHNRSKANQYARQMGQSGQMAVKQKWVQTWKTLEWSDEEVKNALQNLNPVTEARLIWYAIGEHYSENKEQREFMRQQFRDRLINSVDPKAEKLLIEYFPEEAAQLALRRKEHEPSESFPPADPRALSIVLGELLDKIIIQVRNQGIDEFDQDHLEKEAQNIRSLATQFDNMKRLQQRWKRMKDLLPDMLYTEVEKQITDVEVIIHQLAKVNIVTVIGPQSQQPLDSQTKPTDKKVQPTDIALEPPTEEIAQQLDIQAPIYRPRTSRNRLLPAPGDFIEIDLHELNIEEAIKEVTASLNRVIDDETLRILVIIHGYGKEGKTPVIKQKTRELLRQYTEDNLRVLHGENLDGFDPASLEIVQICPRLSFDDLGRNNPGITVVLTRK